MNFSAALAEAMRRAAVRADDRLISVGGHVAVDPLAVVSDDRELFLWNAAAAHGSEGVLSVGFGAQAVVRAHGHAPVDSLRAGARELFSNLEIVGDAQPRLMGGMAFTPGRLGAFRAFGDARFVLPRWNLVRRGSTVTAQLVATRAELLAPGPLYQEVRSVLGTFAKKPQDETPLRMEESGVVAYRRAAQAALEEIDAGNLEKVVVVRAARATGRVSVAKALGRLTSETAPVHFAVSAQRKTFLGASPEVLVAFDGRALKTEAVAGTRPRRGNDSEEIAALMDSEKDAREHEYVVHAIQRALRDGHAQVVSPLQRHVRTLRHVHHLTTPILASAPGTHVLDWVDALHPTPAVCGVPSKDALAFLLEQEGFERGWFAAPIGWFDAEGRGQFAVALRSALVDPSGAELFAGAGLVRGSEVEHELAETEVKLASMRRTLGILPETSSPDATLQHGAP